MPKKIGSGDIIGDQGIALIHQIVADMGFVWNEVHFEAGIDGIIEIRDPQTAVVTNNIIQVQSKATATAFAAEDDEGFDYPCTEKDLEYWLSGNAPVILVRSRPSTREAYWVSLKEYFADLTVREKRRVHFDKAKDRFDVNCRDALADLSRSADCGLYLNPLPKTETLYTNLLPVERYGSSLFLADASYHTARAIGDRLRQAHANIGGEWILKENRILSFYDLGEYPWSIICDQGSVEEFDSDEWALSDDLDKEHDFVWLLDNCLRSMLRPSMRFHKGDKYLYVSASNDLRKIEWSYQSLRARTKRTVFQAYYSKRDPTRVSYYRHSGFAGRFRRYGGAWYLEITPRYFFSRDGRYESAYHGELQSGIKRLERNQAVLGQVAMWADQLRASPTMFAKPYPFLAFGPLATFELEHGLDDDMWLSGDDQEMRETTEPDYTVYPLFSSFLE